MNLALKIYKKLNLKRDLAHNYNLFAVLSINKSSYQDAIKYANLAAEIAETIDSKANQFEAYINLSKSYEAIGDFEKAFDFLAKSNGIHIELTNAEIQQKVADITLKYDYDKKLQEVENQRKIDLAKQKASIDLQNMIIAIISIAVFLLVVLSIFLINSVRTKKKKNELLTEQKKSIDLQNAQLEELNQKLNELNDTKDKFFSIIAHDLKNPIYSLNTMAQIVDSEYETMDETEKKDFIGHISRSSSHVYSLLDNLLTWSRSQRNQIKYLPIEGNIVDFLKTSFDGIEIQVSDKDIEFFLDLENTTIYSDVNLLNTIVRNILSNAIKFTPPKGQIKVSGKVSEGYFLLSIKDSGVGMTKEKLDTLFTTGKNVSTPGTNNEKGTGLGMIISKEFAIKNGGDIKVTSIQGEGTEFTVYIPKKAN